MSQIRALLSSLSVGGCLALAAAAGCADDEEDCSVIAQNAWVERSMREWYLENDQLPDLDPSAFDSPTAYLGALIEDVDLNPSPDASAPDDFSFVVPASVEEDLNTNTPSGVGLLMGVTQDGLQVFDVYGSFEGERPSPASEAGLVRGDRVETFDGVPVERAFDLAPLAGARFIFGFAAGETHTFGVQKSDGRRVDVTLTSVELRPDSVPFFRIFNLGERDIGYVYFRDFDLGSVEGLRRAIAAFADQGVDTVIIDQRYNLGGFLFVADFLGDLLGGNHFGANGDSVFRRENWNEDKAELNGDVFFSTPRCPEFLTEDPDLQPFACSMPPRGLSGLRRLVFINGGNTASASELVLNGMRPYVDVGVVGARSVGKPVGSVPFPSFATGEAEFCGLVLRPTTLRIVNADGEGDYFDGFAPDCPMEDDPRQPLGSAEESSIAAALAYATDGRCPVRLLSPPAPPRRRVLLDAQHTFSYQNSLARWRASTR